MTPDHRDYEYTEDQSEERDLHHLIEAEREEQARVEAEAEGDDK